MTAVGPFFLGQWMRVVEAQLVSTSVSSFLLGNIHMHRMGSILLLSQGCMKGVSLGLFLVSSPSIVRLCRWELVRLLLPGLVVPIEVCV